MKRFYSSADLTALAQVTATDFCAAHRAVSQQVKWTVEVNEDGTAALQVGFLAVYPDGAGVLQVYQTLSVPLGGVYADTR